MVQGNAKSTGVDVGGGPQGRTLPAILLTTTEGHSVMAEVTYTRVDVTALATRLERQSIAINIPYSMARDMKTASLVLRHALKDDVFDTPFQIENGDGR